MGSAGAQNLRPSPAPGEDAPSAAAAADRNEVNVANFADLEPVGLVMCLSYVPETRSLSSMGVADVEGLYACQLRWISFSKVCLS